MLSNQHKLQLSEDPASKKKYNSNPRLDNSWELKLKLSKNCKQEREKELRLRRELEFKLKYKLKELQEKKLIEEQK
jgi:hypothetical protein